MTSIRQWIRNILGFSGRETNGFLILLPLILIIIFSEPLYRHWKSRTPLDFSYEQRVLDSLIATWDHTEPTQQEPEIKPLSPKFEFDPNTATVSDLIRLGFAEKLANRVVTYRQKGGTFRTPDDLKKIYGMDSALYLTVLPYIQIPPRQIVQAAKQPEKAAFQSQKPRLASFDINEADTATLKGVYGIGTKLAERIVKFRSGLGGFVSLNQLAEIYGLDSAVVNRLKKRTFIEENFEPKKLDLNTATESEMSAHPYISKSAAKAIAAWRFQHGAFKSIDEIKNLTLFKAEDIVKIIPYLKVEE